MRVNDPFALLAAARVIPLDTYRNIGIMAHIDAGKVCSEAFFQSQIRCKIHPRVLVTV